MCRSSSPMVRLLPLGWMRLMLTVGCRSEENDTFLSYLLVVDASCMSFTLRGLLSYG